MKGKFDANVLWPLAKSVRNWIVDRSTPRDFTVDQKLKGYKAESAAFLIGILKYFTMNSLVIRFCRQNLWVDKMSYKFHENSCQKRTIQNFLVFLQTFWRKLIRIPVEKAANIAYLFITLNKKINYPLCMRQTCSGKLHNKKILKKTLG